MSILSQKIDLILRAVKNPNTELILKYKFEKPTSITRYLYPDFEDNSKEYLDLEKFLFEAHPRISETEFLSLRATTEFIGAIAEYKVKTDRINILPRQLFESDLAFFKTLAHELVHSTGSKLKRKVFLTNEYSINDLALEENIAEIGAFFILDRFGIESKQVFWTTIDYLKFWQGDKLASEAIGPALDAVEYLFDKKVLDDCA